MELKIDTIDIIIPVYKPGESFPRLLGMLSRQSFPLHRLIIINTLPDGEDNSDKVAALIEREFPGTGRFTLKNISRDEFDHAATRRMAVGLSDADAFVCMTDDAVPVDIYLLERLREALLSDRRIALAYARQLPRRGAAPAEVYTRGFNYPAGSRIKSIDDIGELGIKTFFASNVCCAYRRDIYEELGGFTDNAIFNEDMIYAATALKKGYLTCYMAEARVYHSHALGASEELHRNFDNGLSQALHPEIFAGLRAEGEGIRLIRGTLGYLIRSGHILSVPGLILNSGAKYIGFKLGTNYRVLPKKLVLALALNRKYIEKHITGRQEYI